jgi:hypothetical protein
MNNLKLVLMRAQIFVFKTQAESVRSFRDKKQFFEACKDSASNLNKRKLILSKP